MGGWVGHVRQRRIAKPKMKPYTSRDLKLHSHLYSESQRCVRKTFSSSFVPRPAENHTSHTPLGAMPSRTTHMHNLKSTEYRENKLMRYLQGWCSGESARLPPMCPGFGSRTQRHMWVEFVSSLLCFERFSPGTPVSPLLKNQHLIWFVLIVNFNLRGPLGRILYSNRCHPL